jgi:hypothetical protein
MVWIQVIGNYMLGVGTLVTVVCKWRLICVRLDEKARKRNFRLYYRGLSLVAVSFSLIV